ncbi:glycosyltransferase family 2 protein [uncultured Cycloclasticus sp.]|uniref:glycosyltransferase family 2 protein n=1 Tax=uncultured Cycloclasticus sp. TaxID=172194 RepID=UPI00258475AF|nr:glycosyltransferase family 2 protein [uncultured Cycloclasticus sp.]
MLIDFIVTGIAIMLAIPLLVIGFELLITLLQKKTIVKEKLAATLQGTYKILIPAHNEESIISNTISSLLQQSISPDAILVVADNCTDNTASVAKGLGVTVLERVDAIQRGKGYALDYGLNYIKGDKEPDVIIVLDADCEMEADSLGSLIRSCLINKCPVQALYLMRPNPSASLNQRVAGFAWLVKNKIRPIAINKLGLPVTLTGTGMAFPWGVIAELNVAHGNIVEDMQLGIDCTLSGCAPIFCQEAVVYSDFPEQVQAEKTQRTRWEHGHLATIIQQVPMLFKKAVVNKDWRLLGLALDIGVPPLSLLVVISLILGSFFSIYSFVTEVYVPLFVFLTCFLFFIGLLIATWWRYGREYFSIKELCCIPLYVASKLGVYTSFIFKRQKSWVKTSRKVKGE